jgi:hypothetical protein
VADSMVCGCRYGTPRLAPQLTTPNLSVSLRLEAAGCLLLGIQLPRLAPCLKFFQHRTIHESPLAFCSMCPETNRSYSTPNTLYSVLRAGYGVFCRAEYFATHCRVSVSGSLETPGSAREDSSVQDQ